MLPLRDEIPSRRLPIVTYLLIAANVMAYIWQFLVSSQNPRLAYAYAMIPADYFNGITLSDLLHIFTSMFMHGGLAHIGGNMLYLWIFGDNVEDAMGHTRFLAFYLLGGFLASLAHIITSPTSRIPTVGASGAIAAVLGAYLILYPRARVLTLVVLGFFIRLVMVPATIVLGLWFILQLFQGVMSLGMADMGGVAFWAHIGGFVSGMLLVRLFARPQGPRIYDPLRGRWY